MSRRRYIWNGKKMVEVKAFAKEEKAAYVHSDYIPNLKHPVTGKVFDSKSEYIKYTKSMGSEVVGNDFVGADRGGPKDKITEAVVMDKIHKAEAILSCPDKYRERQHENLQRLERFKELTKWD